MHPVLNRNLFFVKEHAGIFKASNSYDVLDPTTQQIILNCREERLGFVHVPQPPGKRAHHGNREERRLVDEEKERLLVDRGHLAVGLGADRGASHRSIDQGHLAEDAAAAQGLYDAAAVFDGDFAVADDVHGVASIAFGKDHIAGGIARRWKSRIGQHLEVD